MISTREITKGQTTHTLTHTHTEDPKLQPLHSHTEEKGTGKRHGGGKKQRETSGHADAPNIWNKALIARRRPRRAVSSERPELKEKTRSGNYQRGTQLCKWN